MSFDSIDLDPLSNCPKSEVMMSAHAHVDVNGLTRDLHTLLVTLK